MKDCDMSADILKNFVEINCDISGCLTANAIYYSKEINELMDKIMADLTQKEN